MAKRSSQSSKLVVTLVLTLFIFSAFFISGFTISTVKVETDKNLPVSQTSDIFNLRDAPPIVEPILVEAGVPAYAPPADGGGTGQQAPGPSQQQQPGESVDVIRNGGFELPWTEDGLAPEWEGFRNGQAWASWYKETWPEAVRSGKQAQLMEIFQVEPNILDRVIAIFQTVDVAPNSQYDLTFYAIMRSQTQAADRNKFEFEMNWGIDYTGEGSYENVQDWTFIPLTEQFRLGSTGEFPEDVPLRYEVVTGTVFTTNTNRITLFIRGWKKFPTGTEVNFDVDDVSLVGPAPGTAPQPTPQVPAPTAVPTPGTSLPVSGAALARNLSVGILMLGGLILVGLGASAVASVMQKRRD